MSADIGLDLGALETPIVETGGGGAHIYLTIPRGMKLRRKIKAYPGIDFLTHPAQVVGVGSYHFKGKQSYAWRSEEKSLSSANTAGKPEHAPDALLEHLRPVSVLTSGIEGVDDSDENKAFFRDILNDVLETNGGVIEGRYVLACEGRDLGLSQDAVRGVMRDEGWDGDGKLAGKVAHAFTYAQNPHGSKHPAAVFDVVNVNSKISTGHSDASSEWPDPLPLPPRLPPVQPFDYELLPRAFSPFIQDAAERMQCPPDFVAVPLLVVVGAIVGRQVGIRPKRADDWTVIPNLWGALVGRPGVLKTPAVRETLRFINRLEARAKDHYEFEAQCYQASKIVAETAKSNLKERVNKALAEGENAEEVALKALQETSPNEPKRRRYVTNDSTVEKLGEILRDNPRGVLVYRDELHGFLQSLEKRGQEGSRTFYLEAWNGADRFTSDRIGRGTIDIEGTCVSVLGTIQPGPLSEYRSAARQGAGGDDGLLQRFQLIVQPDSSPDWRNIDRKPDKRARDSVWEVLERLDDLDADQFQAECDPDHDIPFLHFASDAQEEFDRWREELELRLRNDGLPEALESHFAKYRSLIPSLALLIHLIDSPGGGPVTLEALRRAIMWGEYLESHARRIYADSVSPELACAWELDRHLAAGDLEEPFTARDVYRKNWRHLDRDGSVGALRLLQELGRIRPERSDEGRGRPADRWRSNPKTKNTVRDQMDSVTFDTVSEHIAVRAHPDAIDEEAMIDYLCS